MSSFLQTSDRIRHVIKQKLAEKNISYSQLARSIGVSVSTVKRWMTKNEMSVLDLDAVLRELGLSWSQFSKILDATQVQRTKLSSTQDKFLSEHPKETFALLLLFHDFSFSEIQGIFGVSEAALESLLLRLDRFKFIEYQDHDRIRVLVRGPFQFPAGGHFARIYHGRALQLILRHMISLNEGMGVDFNPSKPLAQTMEMYLSQKSLVRLKADLWEIAERYRQESKYETATLPKSELKPVTLVSFVDVFPLWKKLLLEES